MRTALICGDPQSLMGRGCQETVPLYPGSAEAEKDGAQRMDVKRGFYLVLGCVSLALGSVGVVVPVLPTFPFFLLSAFCFLRSSRRLHTWLLGTKMYKKHMESYATRRSMSRGTKARILIAVTAVMGFGYIAMREVPVGRIILALVWICHMVYFLFAVKTISPPK